MKLKLTHWTLIAMLICIGIAATILSCKEKGKELFAGEQVTIEGCEYLKMRSYSGYFSLTHKGNCSNPIHKCH